MVNSPETTVKVIVIVHFMLSIWASMFPDPFPSQSYLFMQTFILAFGFWAIVCPLSSDAHIMFAITNVISILMDIIFLSVFSKYEEANPEYNFILGMAIINLLLKPLTSYIMMRIYQDLSGRSLSSMTSFITSNNGYQSSHYDHNNTIETSRPHDTLTDQVPIIP